MGEMQGTKQKQTCHLTPAKIRKAERVVKHLLKNPEIIEWLKEMAKK